MQEKILSDLIIEIAGEQAKGLLEILKGKRDVNEFLIAKKLNLTINQIRNIFYKLANFGLVSFTRKKEKKKGWYTYFWTLKTHRVLEMLEKKVKKEIDNLSQQLISREQRRFYLCDTCKNEVGEETAMLNNFSCAECGQVYVLNEDKKLMELLKARIARLERQREEILQEIQEEYKNQKPKKEEKEKKSEKKGKKTKKVKKETKKKLAKKAKKKK